MPNYLRLWNNRNILVRPTKWDGAEEVAPWDCLDITRVLLNYRRYTLSNSYSIYDYTNNPIVQEIRNNYYLYRSFPFCKTYADNPRMDNPLFGCCVVAAEALFFITTGDDKPSCYRAKDGDGIYHWWVQSVGEHKDEVIIQDATRQQFDELSFDAPYSDGKKTSLMGWKQSPSKRTLDLIGNLSTKTIRYKSLDKSYAPPHTHGTLESFLRD